MFYSHEILTSPEHGVATVWLVATLGSKSISRRLNRKTILDVDVPKACGVIIDPVAPMALRLQSNLLYGVSRVYSQQCGYTLLDTQAMHDRMKTMLKSIPAGGLDPAAGKARPEQLVLPYDPSFLPENNLPGLGLDLSKLNIVFESNASQQSNVFLPGTPDLSQSAFSGISSLQLDLDLPSNDQIMGGVGGFSSEPDIVGAAQSGIDFGGMSGSIFNEEAGVLFQPDFEFDEDGNIIELGGRQHHESRTNRHPFATSKYTTWSNFASAQPMLVGDDIEVPAAKLQATHPSTPRPRGVSIFEPEEEEEEEEEEEKPNELTMRQRQRAPKIFPLDNNPTLRNSDLLHMNENYLKNMASAAKQKQQNKIPTQAKKNAAYWVFRAGVGCVGAGVGSTHIVHPLHLFSGDELYESLVPTTKRNSRKRPCESGEEGGGRRVRSKEGDEENIARGEIENNNLWNEEVEIGRHPSPSLKDGNSSLMPWNITASIQSSRHETSAANILRGLGSVGGPSSWFRRSRSRLTSASPLAGRGFPFDMDRINSLFSPGNQEEDLDRLEGFDLSNYLEPENVMGSNSVVDGAGASTYTSQVALQSGLSQSSMDQESLNFLDFLAAKMDSLKSAEDVEPHSDAVTTPPRIAAGKKEITFSTLLPTQKTSRTVATHGLMHVLALATKGFLSVRQSTYTDQSSEEHGVQYEYGEILIRLPMV
ncbi:hypothetical protein P175DRAFT_0463954 [Aspergillus ochraceoroseus IBT 24754]|uniref:Rad21/Rec8-like protein N-terminal domain-containing protein n=1 Tax=Aspergillus ochraceoroseus IBT 24754 TaxID=1392256 RepID=A0A2T5LRF7_9EURO|nr:uncharacterized protein P175DRAFT_0463954 [Aspergillus ochraceoroseus IBT 24754]PTU18856.1 hypothetical protein P175DRAFT_0463954 [Aspergillus ochraceoroseus IBT 24754]